MQAYRWHCAWTWVLLFSSTQSGRTAERSCCLGPVRCRRVMGSLGDLPAAGLQTSQPCVVTCRTCADNPNPAFASCTVAQELTDDQIDQQHGSSDEEVRRHRRLAFDALQALLAASCTSVSMQCSASMVLPDRTRLSPKCPAAQSLLLLVAHAVHHCVPPLSMLCIAAPLTAGLRVDLGCWLRCPATAMVYCISGRQH